MSQDRHLGPQGRPPALTVVYSFPHELGGAGIGTTAWHQVDGLARQGMTVIVLCTSLRTALPPSVQVIQTLAVAGVRIPHRALGVERAYRYHDARVARWLARTERDIDIVHCWPTACLQSGAEARRRKIPWVRELPNAHTAETFADAHRAGVDTGVALPAGYSHSPNARRLRREVREFDDADFLLAPSAFVADSFRRAGTPDTRLIHHSYGYDPTRFRPADAAPGRAFTAVFVGRGEPAKGLHLALAAWRQARLGDEARLLIVGRMLPAFEHQLRDELADPRVVVTGFVDDVGALLRQADVLVFPTYTEGSALVTYEAMASGVIPLVSTAAGAPVTDGVDALVHDVGDVDTLAAQLRSVHDDAALRTRLREQALDAARELTWDAAAVRVVDGYRTAITRYAAERNTRAGSAAPQAEGGVGGMRARLDGPIVARLRRATRQASYTAEILRRDGLTSVGRKLVGAANARLGAAATQPPIALEDIRDSATLPAVPVPPAVVRDRPLVIGWLTTPPGIGSGGHTTMFRMVQALESAGHSCRIVLYDRFGGRVERHRATIREGWPAVRADVQDVSAGFAGLDACVATAWQTAHVLAARCDEPLRRMFFVQDFEPYFYARGSEYTLAEDAYRFGFSCITIGAAVAHLLGEKHGIDADWVDFGCDTDVYHLSDAGPRNGVVMYAKPSVPRRGYLHNVAALMLLHQRRPDQQIHIFGHDVGDLPFPATHHGELSPAELNLLYNRTWTGLATSFTNMTLIAEEMLAAGNIPVINDSEIGRLGLDNPNVVWAAPTPAALADALSAVIDDPQREARAAAAARSVLGHTWASAQRDFVAIVEAKLYRPLS